MVNVSAVKIAIKKGTVYKGDCNKLQPEKSQFVKVYDSNSLKLISSNR